MSLPFIVVIPARMKSTRLPGKPLADILGQSMIERTYRQCEKAVDPEKIIVATDHPEIYAHCTERQIPAMMTSEDCLTGTDRVAEVATRIKADYYINVQGDEPLFNPADITATIAAIEKHPGEVINGFAPINTEEEYRSNAVPKVVFRPDGRLLYMSRSPIPGNKSHAFRHAWRQICVYAFPTDALSKFAAASQKTPLEASEDIEILRFLEMGYEVRMIPLSADSIAVDHPDDLEKVKAALLRSK